MTARLLRPWRRGQPGILHRQHLDYQGVRGDYQVAGGFA